MHAYIPFLFLLVAGLLQNAFGISFRVTLLFIEWALLGLSFESLPVFSATNNLALLLSWLDLVIIYLYFVISNTQ